MAKLPSFTQTPETAPQGAELISQAEFEALANFRLELRRYLAFANKAAKSCGVTMEQHQAMLAIRASAGQSLSIGQLADLLFLRPHSTAEMVDRMVRLNLIARRKDHGDARRSLVGLTEAGQMTLQALAASHLTELREHGPALARSLRRAVNRRPS